MSEIQKYPYNGRTDDTKKYFSEKVCCCIVRIPKRAIKNREAVYLFVRKLPSNSKGKAKVLVKKPEGRYIVDVSDTEAQIVGVSSRTNKKCMSKFETLMNKLYNLNIKGY